MVGNASGQKLKKQHNYNKRKNADNRRQMQHCPLFRKKCVRKFGSRMFQFMKKLYYLNAI